ncbi:MAG: sensor histidine kinase [Flavisolibacter sp.]
MKRSKFTSAGFILTIVIIIAVAVFQHGSARKQQRLLKQVMQVDSIHEEIAKTGEVLYMTPLLYLVSKDSNWLAQYHKNALLFLKDLETLRSLLPNLDAELVEMEESFDRFSRTVERDLETLTNEDEKRLAARLSGPEYRLAKHHFDSTNNRLKRELKETLSATIGMTATMADVSLYARMAVLLIIVFGWWYYVRSRNKWQAKLNAHYKNMVREATASRLRIDKANEQLRQLFQYLHSIREKENARIAYELHEQVCQQLSAIKARIEIQEQKLEEESQSVLADEIRSVSADMEKINRNLRNMAVEIFPSAIEDIGLAAAMEEECRLLSGSHHVQISFFAEAGELQLPKEQATALFRVFHDVLYQSIKRGATEIVSTLMEEPERVVLFINDNAPAPENYSTSLQSIAMKESIAAAKGNVEVETYPHGTDHTIYLPLKQGDGVPLQHH